MNYRGYTETKMISGAFTMGAQQTLSLRIPQSRRRLEGILLELLYTQTATTTITVDGNWFLIPEVRLKVNDVLGQRNMVQASAPQLIMWASDMTGNVSRANMVSRQCVTAATTQRVAVPIFLRHPCVSEPVGNILGLPLYALNEDPTLEIDVVGGSSATGAGSGATLPPTAALALRATLFYRDVDPAVKYLPSELVNSTWTIAAGNNSFDLANSGFVSAISIDTYSTYPTTRAALFTANDHEYQVNLGPISLRRYYPDALANMNDMQVGIGSNDAAGLLSSGLSLASGVLGGPCVTHHCMDFLFDDSIEGAFSPASLLNANTVQLGGDKIRLTGTNFSGAGVGRVLTHKFLTRSVEDLKALIGS